jgi:hypothetical protein
MPYQDRHAADDADFEIIPARPANSSLPDTAGNGRTIQIIIVVGLIAAVVVAVLGSF